VAAIEIVDDVESVFVAAKLLLDEHAALRLRRADAGEKRAANLFPRRGKRERKLLVIDRDFEADRADAEARLHHERKRNLAARKRLARGFERNMAARRSQSAAREKRRRR